MTPEEFKQLKRQQQLILDNECDCEYNYCMNDPMNTCCEEELGKPDPQDSEDWLTESE